MSGVKIPRRSKGLHSTTKGKKGVFVIARVSAEQRTIIQRAARLAGVNTGEWMRSLLLVAAKKMLNTKGLDAAIPEKYENPKKRGERSGD